MTIFKIVLVVVVSKCVIMCERLRNYLVISSFSLCVCVFFSFFCRHSRYCFNIEITARTDARGSQGRFPFPQFRCLPFTRSSAALQCNEDNKRHDLSKLHPCLNVIYSNVAKHIFRARVLIKS